MLGRAVISQCRGVDISSSEPRFKNRSKYLDSDMEVLETKCKQEPVEIVEIHGTSSEDGEISESVKSHSVEIRNKQKHRGLKEHKHKHKRRVKVLNCSEAIRNHLRSVSTDDNYGHHGDGIYKKSLRKEERGHRSPSTSSVESLHRRKYKLERLLAAENSKQRNRISQSNDLSRHSKRKSDDATTDDRLSNERTCHRKKRKHDRKLVLKREKESMHREERRERHFDGVKERPTDELNNRIDHKGKDQITTEVRINKETCHSDGEMDRQQRDESKNCKEGPSNSEKRKRHEEDKEHDWGSANSQQTKVKTEPVDKAGPDFQLSGKLTEDRNMVNGVVIKYSEPPEARTPKKRWRLYPFKENQAMPTLYIHRQSAYLIGRDRKVADLPVDHPSCSKQHAALQYRLVSYERRNGTMAKAIRLYIIDLESANGTFVNNKKIESRKYVELLEKDVIKFGFSSREYVLLHEGSKGEEDSD